MSIGTIALSALSPTQGFIIIGDESGDNAGWSVSGAGDVSGDGITDLIAGAISADGAMFENTGEAYVVFGKAGTSRSAIEVSDLGASGFIIQGDAPEDLAGFSVSCGGDVNGDGIDDLIVGARRGDDGGGNAGEAYVIFGILGITRDTVNLSNLLGHGFIIQGDQSGDNVGWSVSRAGDVNADGIDDLIVGATGGDDGGENAGQAYVIYGKLGSRETIDLFNLGSDGFIIHGEKIEGRVGHSVAAAGDVNDDGIADVIVGSQSAGEAYVIFGRPGATRAKIELASIDNEGFVILGAAAGDSAGWSVSAGGDLNNDGIDDIVVGAPDGDDGGENAGAAYVIFGKSGATRAAVNPAAQNDEGFVVRGAAAGDQAGYSVSDTGDINGDGVDDFIVGAPRGDVGGEDAGQAYIIFGKEGSGRQDIDLSAIGENGIVLYGDAPDDRVGWSVSRLGDVNGDGSTDLLISAPFGDQGGLNSGQVYVIYGPIESAEQPEGPIIPPAPRADDWQLLAGGGQRISIGGAGQIFGTSEHQVVLVQDVEGSLLFDPSFNRGGDLASVRGNAADWLVELDGTGVLLFNDATFLQIPAGVQGMDIAFDDGRRLLKIDTGSDVIKIGSQQVQEDAAYITSPAMHPSLISIQDLNMEATGRLVMAEDGKVVAGGNLEVFGTAGSEDITLLPGHTSLDPSFNNGGDTLALVGNWARFQAERVGSSVVLERDDGIYKVDIPVGTAGMQLVFDDVEAMLFYDVQLGSVFIGDWAIAESPISLLFP